MTFNMMHHGKTATAKRLTIIALIVSLLLASLSNGFGVLTASAGGTPVTLIGTHAVWKYDDKNTSLFGDVTSDFRSKAFDDSAWNAGPQPLGYPESESDYGAFGKISEVGTLLANKKNPNAYITYYLRTTFSAANIADIESLSAKLAFDDGYNMYLNGQLIDSMYIDETAGHSTPAGYVGEAKDAGSQRVVDLTAYRQFLVEGDGNVIAVDLHNRDNYSSDIYWGMTLDAIYESGEPEPEPSDEPDAEATPAQVNVHMGDAPSTQANFTFTTVKPSPSTVTLDDGSGPLSFTGESSVGAADKYFHKIAVSGLAPDTVYNYTLGEAPNTFAGKFKTAPEPGDTGSFKFVYLADTQVSNATNAEALGATLAEVADMNPDFVYLAGDITDTSTNESQWEWMFKNNGAFPEGGQEMFSNYLIAAIQGNHDNNTFNRHINAPAQQGNIVYSFDYGPATFVMLNLEAARSDADAREAQKTFLTAAVNEAKARGQWVAVGFHKSLYTGASHITDSDVVDARKYWCPVFAQLDADFVLQGHDHVYSRGFVNADGTKA
ncbi:MAG: metallophosphoesterase family protein, partial [Clostridiales Family XIII bacterium]|nr:metallophosphoesterase family protein [Clostridiales Family XIII bacterium]